MSLHRPVAVTAVCALVAACATTAPRSIYVKPGSEPTVTLADHGQCDSRSLASGVSPMPMVGGGIAGAIALGLAVGVTEGLMSARTTESCMRARGYGSVALTKAEQTDYAALKTKPEKREWLAKRMAAGSAPAQTALIGAPAEAGAVRIVGRF